MNSFDRAVLLFINSFAGRSPTIDNFVSLVAENMLLKGTVFVFLFWWLWFRRDPEQAKKREFILLGALAPFFAVLVARIAANAFPFRERPLRAPGVNLHLPYGMDSRVLEGWSSFPSDHAAFFFALSAVLFFVCRRAGIFAIAYSLLVVCLPRVYLGIHYPTDLIAGAAIGAGVGCITLCKTLREAVTRPALWYLDSNPSVFYGCLSVLTYILGTVCEPVPELIRFTFRVIAASLGRTGHPALVVFGKHSIEPLVVAIVAIGTITLISFISRKRVGSAAAGSEACSTITGEHQPDQLDVQSIEPRKSSGAVSSC
jgi:undecaprenyl-diphosphatase